LSLTSTEEELEEDDAHGASRGPSLRERGCAWIGCLLIIAVLVGLAALVYFGGRALEPLADRYLWAPHDVVREYLLAYEDDDRERARRFLCSEIRDGLLLDPSLPVGSPSVWTASVDDVFPYPRDGGRVAIYYEVSSGLGDRRAQALIEREDDGWRICAFE
jgi:hypothetical protein